MMAAFHLGVLLPVLVFAGTLAGVGGTTSWRRVSLMLLVTPVLLCQVKDFIVLFI